VITYLKHKQIDKTKWDRCIDQSINPIVYAQAWYLDRVCKGWDALVYGDYEAVMPLTHAKKYGIKYLYQPFFTQQLGVFMKPGTDRQLVNMFLLSIPYEFRFVDISLNKSNELQLPEFQVLRYSNFELKMDRSYSEIENGYSKNTTRNIKKALQHGLNVSYEVKPGELIELFKANIGRDLTHMMEGHYENLKQIMDFSLKENKAILCGVRNSEGNLSAGAFFIQSYDSYIFLFSATNAQSKANGAMFLIVDQLIRDHSEKIRVLDFEGSNVASLARFYKSFGSDEFNYLRIKRNRLPWILKLLKK